MQQQRQCFIAEDKMLEISQSILWRSATVYLREAITSYTPAEKKEDLKSHLDLENIAQSQFNMDSIEVFHPEDPWQNNSMLPALR